MQSLYLSKPSSKYTSPAELGMRVVLNITDPLRMMLFSCKETNHKAIQPHSFAIFEKVLITGEVKFYTYSSEIDVSTHFKLYSLAHYVDTLISTNDGIAVTFNVQVRCRTTCDLKSQKNSTINSKERAK